MKHFISRQEAERLKNPARIVTKAELNQMINQLQENQMVVLSLLGEAAYANPDRKQNNEVNAK